MKPPAKKSRAKRAPTNRAPYQDPEKTLGFLMWDTTRGFVRHFSKRIGQHGVNFGHWPFLRVLWAEDGLTQAELAARVKMRGPTTVAAVDWLERHGFVRREPHPEDLRKVNVFLTAKGRKVYPLLVPEIRYVNERAAGGMTREEVEVLKRLLGRMRQNLDENGE
jgi:DNA-binding MarR family transcriptional regulator